MMGVEEATVERSQEPGFISRIVGFYDEKSIVRGSRLYPLQFIQ